MTLDVVAAFCAGAALAGIVMLLRKLSGNRLPRWAVPAAAGLGMLLFTIWNEYSWYSRVTARLPEAVVILSSPAESMAFRPWTYLVPISFRFMALDVPGMVTSAENPALRRADALLVQRWKPTLRIPLAFDCATGRRADLLEGAELAPDGTLTGADWQEVGPEDELQRAACREG